MERRSQMPTITVLVGVSVILSYAHSSGNLDVENINDIVDQILITLKEEKSILSGLEPVSFPNITQRDFKTWNGSISGLSNIHRHGNASLLFHSNKTITFGGHLGANNIAFSMNYKVRPLFLWYDGFMKGGVYRIAVEISLYTDGEKFHLKSLRVSHLDGFNINHVSVLGMPSSMLLQELANTFATKYKGRIVAALEDGTFLEDGMLFVSLYLATGMVYVKV